MKVSDIMEETKIDFVPEKEEKKKGKFQAKCFHCKEKERMTTDNGMEFDLPFAYVELKKDKELLKECKNYAKESKEKYGNENVIKRRLLNGCPKCGHNIDICCKDYADFYSTKKETKNEK